ncbi:YceD family protein [Leucobacter salsicius]|uniref:YceD family protein n=1 Tax=Leucobacter salsicius TaxID=664638 RepID=UPI00034AE58B|nr:YceD family protein [Leucobacter salsicius]
MNATRVYEENIRDLANRPGEMRERSRVISVPEQFGEALAVVPAGTEMELEVRLESVHEGVLASVKAYTTLQAECGRCLKEFATPFQVEFQELFAYTPTEADDYGVHGDHVDLEPPLRDAVVLALPFQPMCRPDCPGLDPESGELREAEAAVESDVDLDPRWAALARFAAGTVTADEKPDSGELPESKSK